MNDITLLKFGTENKIIYKSTEKLEIIITPPDKNIHIDETIQVGIMESSNDGIKICVTILKAFPSPTIESGKSVPLGIAPPFSEKNLLSPEKLKINKMATTKTKTNQIFTNLFTEKSCLI